MKKSIFKHQQEVLKALAGEVDDFYLVGGTALSLFYFQHRYSEDLDFFTQEFDHTRVKRIAKLISDKMDREVTLIGEQTRKDRLQVAVYNVRISKDQYLKIDFVEDGIKIIKPLRVVDGIPIVSLEDIYLRKILAVTGVRPTMDSVGRKELIGGRQEARDLYDIYYLSRTFLGLADFAARYCDSVRKEALVRWYHTYGRLQMKTGLLEIRGKRKIDYRMIERHLKGEIDRLLEGEVDFV